jgi:hypothetical protein
VPRVTGIASTESLSSDPLKTISSTVSLVVAMAEAMLTRGRLFAPLAVSSAERLSDSDTGHKAGLMPCVTPARPGHVSALAFVGGTIRCVGVWGWLGRQIYWLRVVSREFARAADYEEAVFLCPPPAGLLSHYCNE